MMETIVTETLVEIAKKHLAKEQPVISKEPGKKKEEIVMHPEMRPNDSRGQSPSGPSDVTGNTKLAML